MKLDLARDALWFFSNRDYDSLIQNYRSIHGCFPPVRVIMAIHELKKERTR